ncbi:acetyl/propionyl/methylcrotonyl-CoA carboxylase subunit alpha [Lutimaribacter marinistellae]|uniref:Acetyl/propionyl/methylcrotonyl-CoA carboxylase subunit alpha n=1 Tax=Lutimaribacter marinistellae TaxID=1820329 RepID=A0ABV7THU8_9RHOB
MSFDTILIANRGEIAARIIRSAQAIGLRAVAVHTVADATSPHVELADEAVEIGDGPVGSSYLDACKILEAARATGAGAIHPGYGFLSENAAFAEAVEAAGLTFIGPRPEAIRAMGNKAEAKRLMIAAGVPCVPGYEGADQSDAVLTAAAAEIGLPLMVKAAAGGGGRGMRLVQRQEDLADALALARSEAANAFGSDELILERAVIAPRHVEVQVFADAHGSVIHLGERDCSVQRRHQKVVEEAPCPVMTPELRDRMGKAAIEAARAVDYRGAGTVEFLLDDSGEFYFLEMNTRLQVEHPVTEMVTGLDLVAMQIAVAQGEPLPVTQEDVALTGHAIEVRLYAEDPANGYLPATGPVHLWRAAEGEGIRVDAGIREGQEISPFYDPMLAKIIAHGPAREIARARLIKAVERTVLLGCVTNARFLRDVLALDVFAAGEARTDLLDNTWPDGVPAVDIAPRHVALAGALILQADRQAALSRSGYVAPDQLGWCSAPQLPSVLTLALGEERYELRATAKPEGWQIRVGDKTFSLALQHCGGQFRVSIDGQREEINALVRGHDVFLASGADRIAMRRLRAGRSDAMGDAGGMISAPMPGLVLEMRAGPGDQVTKGDTLAVLEAMKMQHRITAPITGTVRAVHTAAGAQIASGDAMIEIEEDAA